MSEVKKFTLDDGTESSRSAYIRQEFNKGRSRGDITKELEVPYYIVYSATANMFNEAHPEGGGRAFGGARGTMVEHPETGAMVSRASLMREMVEAGTSRGEVAKQFEVPYATVYAATKEIKTGAEGTHGGKVMITDPETGEEIARVDYIRAQFEAGKSRREIANELSCDYAVVWAATKEKKEDEVAPEAEGEESAEVASEDTGEELVDQEPEDGERY